MLSIEYLYCTQDNSHKGFYNTDMNQIRSMGKPPYDLNSKIHSNLRFDPLEPKVL